MIYALASLGLAT
jgi:Ca2+ transporting ATPase